METKYAITAVVVIAGTVAVVRLRFVPERQSTDELTSQSVKTMRQVTDVSRQFAGDAECARCHADIATAWQNNGMSVSWRDADPSALASHPSGPVSDPNGPFRYQVLTEDASVTQEEAFSSPTRTQSHRVAARYFVGSGKHALAMVAEESGYLTQLPLAWFPSQQWRLSPGYELHNRRFD